MKDNYEQSGKNHNDVVRFLFLFTPILSIIIRFVTNKTKKSLLSVTKKRKKYRQGTIEVLNKSSGSFFFLI
jgi:hypothetical protein